LLGLFGLLAALLSLPTLLRFSPQTMSSAMWELAAAARSTIGIGGRLMQHQETDLGGS
jgi:hypothetical protein